tara:strand:+ start:34543 stop:35175 length:633 start_codon:yes stop_codon:yes gene_type:complete
MMTRVHIQYIFRLLLLLFFCFGSTITSTSCSDTHDYSQVAAFTEDGTVYCVIEIPAGTNKKIEFNKMTKKFEVDQRNGRDRIINFLPYPTNYGFIPNTLLDPEEGGDGDAIDVLILAETLPTGTVIEAFPIAILHLRDDGENDYKILASPKDARLRLVPEMSLAELQKTQANLLLLLEQWFLHYDPEQPATANGWGNEKEAIRYIRSARR